MLPVVCQFRAQTASDLDYWSAQERSLRRASVPVRRWFVRLRKAIGPRLQLIGRSLLLTCAHPSSTVSLLLNVRAVWHCPPPTEHEDLRSEFPFEALGLLVKGARPAGRGWPCKLCDSCRDAKYFRRWEISRRSASIFLSATTARLRKCTRLAKAPASGKVNRCCWRVNV